MARSKARKTADLIAGNGISTADIADDAITDAKINSTKLDGIETNADVTDTTNVATAGALMDSEVTNLAQVKAFDSSDYATAAQGALADSALQGNQTITLSGDVSGSGTTSISVTVADDSHNHVISNVDGLQAALDAKQATLTAGVDYLAPDGDGSGLSGITAYTKSSSDPATNTNGSAGDIWVNYSSGKIYICTDATTDANLWINIHDSTDAVYPNTAPTNPTNTGSFPSSADTGESFDFTFSGATDSDSGYGDSVTAYLVDNFSSGNLTVTTAEVSAGSAHSFTVGSLTTDETLTFRVRAKDSNGAYSSGVTVSIDLIGPVFVAATGGTVTTDGDYKIHRFTSSGTFTITEAGNAAGSNTIEYIAVAGGGAGGGRGGYPGGGGGGAGGYVYNSAYSASAGSKTVTIGGGASGGSSSDGSNGSSSVFDGNTANGGGGGGGYQRAGLSGGCGGGAGRDPGSGVGGNGNQGGNGGGSTGYGGANYSGGGGGIAANGGQGSFTAPSGLGGSGATYMGYTVGGGGGGSIGNSSYPASGGSGGGGTGRGGGAGSSGGSGSANTGGGGGGGNNGGSGGSGVVIIKYKFQ